MGTVAGGCRMCSRLGVIWTGRVSVSRKIGEHIFNTYLSIARGRLGKIMCWGWVITSVLMGWVGSFGLYCIMLMSFLPTSVPRLDRIFQDAWGMSAV